MANAKNLTIDQYKQTLDTQETFTWHLVLQLSSNWWPTSMFSSILLAPSSVGIAGRYWRSSVYQVLRFLYVTYWEQKESHICQCGHLVDCMLPAKPISNLASCIEDHDTGMSLVVIAPMHRVESLLPRRVPEIDQHVPCSHFCAVPGITVLTSIWQYVLDISPVQCEGVGGELLGCITVKEKPLDKLRLPNCRVAQQDHLVRKECWKHCWLLFSTFTARSPLLVSVS